MFSVKDIRQDVSPKSLGLTDEPQIRKLLKFTRISIKCLYWNNHLCMPISGSLMYFLSYYFFCSSLEIIIYGIPNSILDFIWCLFVWNIVDIQFVCFYIICLYLKMKINRLNERLIEMKRRKRFIRIRETLQSFDSLYSEINEYNTTFWSKFLLIFWMTFGCFDILIIYVTIFREIPLFVKIVLIYASIFWTICFLIIFSTASSVNYSLNKSYKTLNSLIISYSKHNNHFYYSRITNNLKVKMKISPFL